MGLVIQNTPAAPSAIFGNVLMYWCINRIFCCKYLELIEKCFIFAADIKEQQFINELLTLLYRIKNREQLHYIRDETTLGVVCP